MSAISMSEPEPDDERDMDVENAEKRAHHNALERKRRDHIKDSFNNLRDAVPILKEEKVVSRASILKKAADYLIYMQNENKEHTKRITESKNRVILLEAQLAKLIEIKQNGLGKAEQGDLQIVYDETLENSNSSNNIKQNVQSAKDQGDLQIVYDETLENNDSSSNIKQEVQSPRND